MSVETDPIKAALRRRRRWILAFSFGPPLIAFVLPFAALFLKSFGLSSGWHVVEHLLWMIGAACAPVTLAVILALTLGFRRGAAAAYWPALCGALAAAAGLFLGRIDTEGGIGLVEGWLFAIKLGAGGAIVGLGLAHIRALRFRLPCERALDALRCRRCGYSLAGLESPLCPECGARRPPT